MRGAHAARAALLMISCGSGLADGNAGEPAAGTAKLEDKGPAAMPGGLARLCERDPSFCARATDEDTPAPVNLTLLAAVNGSVNHRIASTTDRQLYGREEYWTLPATAGDCEDYVLLKRRMLMGLGVSARALLITVVHDENGEGHAVLTVPAADGDLVLDNRRDEILPWWQTGYSFIKRQSRADPAQWVSLGHDRLQATVIASGPGLP